MNAKLAIFILLGFLLTLAIHAEDGWKVIDEGFLLTVPVDWQKQNVHPIDSNAGAYKSPRADLEFDEFFMGYTTNQAQSAFDKIKKKESNPKLLKPNEEVWHVQGRLADFWYGKVDPAVYGKRRFANVASLFIPYVQPGERPGYLDIFVLYKSEKDLPTARRVLRSVAWKERAPKTVQPTAPSRSAQETNRTAPPPASHRSP